MKKSLYTLKKENAKFYKLWAKNGTDTETRSYGTLAVTPNGEWYLQNFIGFRPVNKDDYKEVTLFSLTENEAVASL